MIHVPDVRETAEWYTSVLNFELTGQHEMESELTWARLTYGGCNIMLNLCGKPSDAHRREFDLYILTSELDDLYSRLHSRVEIVEAPHDTEYGMREFRAFSL